MSDKILNQRKNIKFCVKFGKSATETLALLTVGYGEYAMKKSSVFERHRRPKKARMSHSSRSCLCVSSIIRGIVHNEFIARGQTMNQQCYLKC
jgi:hypothetical protein